MFNLKKFSQTIIPTEKMLIDRNKELGLSSPTNPGSYEYLLKDDRKNQEDNVINEKLLETARKDAQTETGKKGFSSDVIMEKNLNSGKNTLNPTRTDDKDKIPLMDYAKEAENKISEQFVEANNKDERDTEFWDKYIGVQLTNDKTTIVNNSQTSQMVANFDTRKDFNKDNKSMGKKAEVIEQLKTADALLYHIYRTASTERRELAEKEKQMVTDINSGKIRILAQFSPAEADHQLGSDQMVMKGDLEEEKLKTDTTKEVIPEEVTQYAVEYYSEGKWIRLNDGKLFEDAEKAGKYMQGQIERMSKIDSGIRIWHTKDMASKFRVIPVKTQVQ
jgi:hypothetical protein